MRKYIIVGTVQSGSTRIFNMIRIISEIRNLKCYSSLLDNNFDSNYDVIVHKTHDLEDTSILKNYDYVILPLRDFRDSYISSIQRTKNRGKNVNINLSHVKSNINIFRKFKKFNPVVFKYEDYNFNYVKVFIHKIKIALNDNNIRILMNKLDKLLVNKNVINDDTSNDFKESNQETINFYKKTLFSKSHNTSGGKSKKYLTYFTKEENDIFKKDKFVYNFLKKHRYEK